MERKGYSEENACDILDVDLEAYHEFKESHSELVKEADVNMAKKTL